MIQQRTEKFVSIFGFVLLLCKLLRKELGEFVSAMERNPSCSMKTHDEMCESQFCKEIGRKTSKERRDEHGRRIFVG